MGAIDDPHAAPADLVDDVIFSGDETPLRQGVKRESHKVFVRESGSWPSWVSRVAQLPQNRDVSGFSA